MVIDSFMLRLDVYFHLALYDYLRSQLWQLYHTPTWKTNLCCLTCFVFIIFGQPIPEDKVAIGQPIPEDKVAIKTVDSYYYYYYYYRIYRPKWLTIAMPNLFVLIILPFGLYSYLQTHPPHPNRKHDISVFCPEHIFVGYLIWLSTFLRS